MRPTPHSPFPTPSSSGVSRGSPRNAFSLVELSIVLVILGLLTGGILAGQSLIRAAELRAVVSEYQRYIAAVNTFRDKYQATPGDMNNATRFWNRSVNQTWCVTNSAATVTTPGTCDGNGNGMIVAAGGGSQSGELFEFWRQLALAGLIEGNYTGIAGSGNGMDATLGTNSPASKMNNSGWTVLYSGVYGDGVLYTMDYGNILEFGASTTTRAIGANLKPEEAWNIDTKLDDGRPAYGRVIARYWNNACSTPDSGAAATTNLNASYMLSNSAIACALNFRQAF